MRSDLAEVEEQRCHGAGWQSFDWIKKRPESLLSCLVCASKRNTCGALPHRRTILVRSAAPAGSESRTELAHFRHCEPHASVSDEWCLYCLAATDARGSSCGRHADVMQLIGQL